MVKYLFIQSGYENIGIESLSANLKKHGYQVDLVFFPYDIGEANENSKISNKINEYKPDIIAFSPFSSQFDWSRNKAKYIKKKYPKLYILFGGVHINSVPHLILKNRMIDGIILGEADETIVDFSKNWEKRKIDETPSLWYRKSGKIIKNQTALLEKNLDKFPHPDKELFYSKLPNVLKKMHYTAIGSRGCPYACTYCSNNVYQRLYAGQKRLRYISPEKFVEEIEIAKNKYNFSRVEFVDDVLAVDFDRLKKLMRLYKRKIGLPFSCFFHPQLVDTKIIKLLKNGGCDWLKLGLQSANEEYRHKYLNRHETNTDVIKVSKLCKKYGLKFSLDHIFGLPGETKEHLIEAVEFYNECRPDVVNWAGLIYLPATTIIQYGLKFKTIEKRDLIKINNGTHQLINLYHKTSLFNRCTGNDKTKLINISAFMFLFVLVSFLPKRLIKFFLKIKFYNLAFNIPNIVIVVFKIFTKIKAGQSYLYIDSLKITIVNKIQKGLFKFNHSN